jgi:hypothetical protein
MNNPNIPLVQPPTTINYSLIPTVNNSMYLNGFPSSYFYPSSNPFGFISSYTETDPRWSGNSSTVARYNFGNNNFNGTGNFTTTGWFGSLTSRIAQGRFTNLDTITLNATNITTLNITATIHITKTISGTIYGSCTNSSGWTFLGNLSTGAICNQ